MTEKKVRIPKGFVYGKRPTTKQFKDITGQRFYRLKVLKFAGYVHHKCGLRTPHWECLCACGNRCIVARPSLANGLTRSCGCLHKEVHNAGTHGMSHSKAYLAYQGMLQRTSNPKANSYKNYGARGIEVCERWRESFENFYADMGEPPTSSHTLDRKDNDGNYEPDNCRWVTRKTQQRNTRGNRIVHWRGRDMCVAEVAELERVPVARLYQGLYKGRMVADIVERLKAAQSR